MYPPMPESTPTPGSGVQSGAGQAGGPGPKGIGPVALVIGILAAVIVLGVVTGLVVMLVRSRGPEGPVSPPAATVTPDQPSPDQPSPDQPSPDQPSPDRPGSAAVSVGNLPTSGDLTWPGGSWNSGATSASAGEEPMSPCQTWRPSELAGLTGSAGREFTLQGSVQGRGHAYVLGFSTEDEVAAAYERLMTDADGCAARVAGSASERHESSAPWGSGEFVDVTIPGPAGDRTVSWGVGRVGTRLVWLATEVDGTEVGQVDPQADPAHQHIMINSLPKAMQRLR